MKYETAKEAIEAVNSAKTVDEVTVIHQANEESNWKSLNDAVEAKLSELNSKEAVGLNNGLAELIKDMPPYKKKGDSVSVSDSTYQELFKKGYVK